MKRIYSVIFILFVFTSSFFAQSFTREIKVTSPRMLYRLGIKEVNARKKLKITKTVEVEFDESLVDYDHTEGRFEQKKTILSEPLVALMIKEMKK